MIAIDTHLPLPPLFRAFLEQLFSEDAGDVAAHLRHFLNDERPKQHIFVGSGSTGKSALQKVLTSLFPDVSIYCVNSRDDEALDEVPTGAFRHFLHFRRVFKPEEQDPLVADRIIATEVDLIRAWALAR